MKQFYGGLMRLCGGIAAALVAAMTLLVCYDVITRNIGIGNISWVLDLSEYMLPMLICVSAPWLMYRSAHIRLDLLRMVAGPGFVRATDRLSSVVATIGSAVFTYYSLALLLDSRETGSMVIKALVFPEWWTYIPVPIGFALLTVECGRQIFTGADAAIEDLVS